MQENDQLEESHEKRNETKTENSNEDDNVSELPSISLIIESFPIKKGKSVDSLDVISAVEVSYCVKRLWYHHMVTFRHKMFIRT